MRVFVCERRGEVNAGGEAGDDLSAGQQYDFISRKMNRKNGFPLNPKHHLTMNLGTSNIEHRTPNIQ
jgi:hypothetical protein